MLDLRVRRLAGSIAWHRVRRERKPTVARGVSANVVATWRGRTKAAAGTSLDTAESLALVTDFGVPTVRGHVVESEQQAIEAAKALGYPVVLKTLAPGIDHKFDQRGVYLGLGSQESVVAAYRDLNTRLGVRVLVQAHAAPGTEIFLGMTTDPQFGPLLTVGLGGVFVEVLRDVVTFVPPVDVDLAVSYLKRLKGFALLDGARSRPRADLRALGEVIAQFGSLASSLADDVQEIDINPIIAGPAGAFAVDALVIPR